MGCGENIRDFIWESTGLSIARISLCLLFLECFVGVLSLWLFDSLIILCMAMVLFVLWILSMDEEEGSNSNICSFILLII